MITKLDTEKSLNTAWEVKLTKNSDYLDTLTFKLPVDEEINIDEVIQVQSRVFKQKYRVKEIIVKDQFKDVYCEHVFLDCKHIIVPFVDEADRKGESYNDFVQYNSLRLITSHLNRIMRAKEGNEFEFTYEFEADGTIECNDSTLYEVLFGDTGVLKTFNCELVYNNYKIKFVKTRPARNTEILFHEEKNVTELQETADLRELVTRLHVTCEHRPDNSEEGKAQREKLKAEKRKKLFEQSQQRIKEREKRQAQERERKRQLREQEYQNSRNRPKKTRAQIHAEHLQKQRENEARILANNEAREKERERKFKEREEKRVNAKKEKEQTIFRTVYSSPLISQYSRVYEASLSFSAIEVDSPETLKAWCQANLFTEEDHRDVPMRNFTFKPTTSDYDIDIGDKAMVSFTSIGTNKVVQCCKLEYDVLHDKYTEVEFGVLTRSPLKNALHSISSKLSETRVNMDKIYNVMDTDFNTFIEKELEAFDEQYRIDREELLQDIEQGFQESEIKAEQYAGEIATDIDDSIKEFRSDVDRKLAEFNNNLGKINNENIDSLIKEIESTKETVKSNFKLIGNDIVMTYGKNRVSEGTELEIPLQKQFVEVSHNGKGFEVGEKYTISWEAVCVEYDHYDIKLKLNKAIKHPLKVSLIHRENIFETITTVFNVGETEKTVLHVYDSHYILKVESLWYKEQNSDTNIKSSADITVPIEYLEIADSNGNDIEGNWNENPTYIFDGGR
nr:MAG TPA: tail protein [Caudoviricetes sp.]